MRFKLVLATILLLNFSAACTNVKSWEKQAYANQYMGLSPEPTYESYLQHVYFSKEAHQGGYGSSQGGGCGCN